MQPDDVKLSEKSEWQISHALCSLLGLTKTEKEKKFKNKKVKRKKYLCVKISAKVVLSSFVLHLCQAIGKKLYITVYDYFNIYCIWVNGLFFINYYL